jgi:hypothetical protein
LRDHHWIQTFDFSLLCLVMRRKEEEEEEEEEA